MLVVITFFSLVAVSLMARLFDKGKYKHNFIVFTLKYAPLVCAFMGAAFVLALICCNPIVRLFSLSASAGLFLVQMLAVIAIMIGFGFNEFSRDGSYELYTYVDVDYNTSKAIISTRIKKSFRTIGFVK